MSKVVYVDLPIECPKEYVNWLTFYKSLNLTVNFKSLSLNDTIILHKKQESHILESGKVIVGNKQAYKFKVCELEGRVFRENCKDV